MSSQKAGPERDRDRTPSMPPPTPLKIKTSSVARLMKEEQSYHKEIALQKDKIQRMETAGDDIYEINQQKKVLKDTEQMIPELHSKLTQAVEILEIELASLPSRYQPTTSLQQLTLQSVQENVDEDSEEKQLAVQAVEQAKKVYAGSSVPPGSDLFSDLS
ncbi:LOW QUALITY PROTEIN: hypothetical protein Dda_4863 [Drechslerella dactyloides]|uniref:Tubulin-specific chaperone A n=1 Tax=Drechslerella dactyloides TaxID=74499 RepID=A0AAD6NIB8_DREDA|nr:LOW QUALITY PROTEIN: hypothetical protein Dda_4863 [Drechslerella dactyloides]